MILLRFLTVLATVALLIVFVRISLLFRARAMRAFAARWGLQYIGPSAFTWRFARGRLWVTLRRTEPPVPFPFSLTWWQGNEIWQVWNVIEGQQSGVSVLIFDSFIEGYKDVYRTFLACKTEQNPFEIHKLRENVVHSHGWTILHGVPFPLVVPWATWSMSIKRLDDHLNTLRVGSGVRA